MNHQTIDTVKTIGTAIAGTGIWIWLDVHATAIGAAVGLATIIYLSFACTNMMLKWCRKSKK